MMMMVMIRKKKKTGADLEKRSSSIYCLSHHSLCTLRARSFFLFLFVWLPSGEPQLVGESLAQFAVRTALLRGGQRDPQGAANPRRQQDEILDEAVSRRRRPVQRHPLGPENKKRKEKRATDRRPSISTENLKKKNRRLPTGSKRRSARWRRTDRAECRAGISPIVSRRSCST